MSVLGENRSMAPRTELLDHLTDGRRRRTLAILRDRSEPLDETALAEELAALESEARSRAVRVELRHSHLPRLAEAGLVSWNRSEATVRATSHPAYADPAVGRLLDATDERDAVFEAIADEQRRHVLTVLDSRSTPLSRDELAREVAARDADGAPSDRAVDDVRGRLHHVHLPALESAGLLEYDADDGTVSPTEPAGAGASAPVQAALLD